MKAVLYVRLGMRETVRWARVEDPQRMPAVSTGTLADAAQAAARCRVVVFVPATDIILTRAAVPSRNRARLLQALPYALEEQLAGDVDALHFAAGTQGPDNVVFAAAVARAQIDAWLQRCFEAGLRPAALVPDVLALPYESDAWTLMYLDDGTAVLRTGPESGFGIDADNADQMLQLALAEAGEERPTRLKFIDCRSPSPTRPGVLETLELSVDPEACGEGVLPRLIEGFGERGGINLLQGSYAQASDEHAARRWWMAAAVLCALWLGTHTAAVLVENARLERRGDELQSQIIEVYRETFPEARQVPNPRVQMERELAALRSAGQRTSFLDLFAEVGGAMQGAPGLALRNIAYRNGQMDMSLSLANLRALDRIKQALNARQGISVDVQSASAQGQEVSVNLRVWGGRQ